MGIMALKGSLSKLIVDCSFEQEDRIHEPSLRLEFEQRDCEAIAQREGKPLEEVSLLDLLLSRGLDVSNSCGGMGTCGTCRVHFMATEEVPPLSELEVELRELRNESTKDLLPGRQSCQIFVARALNGTVWRVRI